MRGPPETSFPSQPENVRSYFVQSGCHIHGHPSSGGILIKRSANLVDLQLLSLPRIKATNRSQDAGEEDAFCESMRRVGASWWESEADFLRSLVGNDLYDGDPADEEKDPLIRAANEARARKIVIFGWPADSSGVWILKFRSREQTPSGFGRLNFAISMDERIEVMKQLGADFVGDLSQVEELQEPWSYQLPDSSQSYAGYQTETDDESTSSDCEGS